MTSHIYTYDLQSAVPAAPPTQPQAVLGLLTLGGVWLSISSTSGITSFPHGCGCLLWVLFFGCLCLFPWFCKCKCRKPWPQSQCVRKRMLGAGRLKPTRQQGTPRGKHADVLLSYPHLESCAGYIAQWSRRQIGRSLAPLRAPFRELYGATRGILCTARRLYRATVGILLDSSCSSIEIYRAIEP